jgi:hypothetical protein
VDFLEDDLFLVELARFLADLVDFRAEELRDFEALVLFFLVAVVL